MHIKAISMEGEYVNFYENPVKRVMQFTERNTHAVVIIFVMRSRILNQMGSSFHWGK